MWDAFYPLAGLDEPRRRLIAVLLKTLPAFAALLANHRPPALRGRTLPRSWVSQSASRRGSPSSSRPGADRRSKCAAPLPRLSSR